MSLRRREGGFLAPLALLSAAWAASRSDPGCVRHFLIRTWGLLPSEYPGGQSNQDSPEKQNQQRNRGGWVREREKDGLTDYYDLAHAITEAERSQVLQGVGKLQTQES